jgi:hypothetical protein
MTQASFPFEGIDTTETQFSKWARHFNSGVDDVPTGTALEVSAGTGLAVDVEAGEAMVRGHYYTSDATEALALATADATNDRIDTVVLRLDPTANSIILAVKTGTPAGSPTAPALVQTDAAIFEQPLADVLVPATAGRAVDDYGSSRVYGYTAWLVGYGRTAYACRSRLVRF